MKKNKMSLKKLSLSKTTITRFETMEKIVGGATFEGTCVNCQTNGPQTFCGSCPPSLACPSATHTLNQSNPQCGTCCL